MYIYIFTPTTKASWQHRLPWLSLSLSLSLSLYLSIYLFFPKNFLTFMLDIIEKRILINLSNYRSTSYTSVVFIELSIRRVEMQLFDNFFFVFLLYDVKWRQYEVKCSYRSYFGRNFIKTFHFPTVTWHKIFIPRREFIFRTWEVGAVWHLIPRKTSSS